METSFAVLVRMTVIDFKRRTDGRKKKYGKTYDQ
jgi:hypothetical protein